MGQQVQQVLQLQGHAAKAGPLRRIQRPAGMHEMRPRGLAPRRDVRPQGPLLQAHPP